MILVYCYCQRDEALALENLRWWNELGGCKGHNALLFHDKRCRQDTVKSILEEATKAFGQVSQIEAGAVIDGWPQGANYFFGLSAACLARTPGCTYFFWMEPDAIPVKENWMDAIAGEYERSGRPFMGDRVQVENIPLHMSGIGVYQNPLHKLAGEAFRATPDLAWDMAAAHQIVPNAHWTKLIEHAWKHPTFTEASELGTQIRPEAVIFHSSKDGSLITLLRQNRGGKYTNTLSVGEHEKRPEEPGQPSPIPPETFDIFIRTYPGDYGWLEHCLSSIRKYASGFRKIWVVSPQPIPFQPADVEWLVKNEETEDHYLSQQIHKLYSDVFTDYQADYIVHIDSDTLLTGLLKPQDFFRNGKLEWLYTPYSAIQTPWKEITEKFMGGKPVENEFMRRFPIVIPRWLYSKMREFVYGLHKVSLGDYVKNQPLRSFSEFNALGAYAWEYHHDKFEWVNTIATPREPFARQFHSWGGITPEVKAEIESILSGAGTGTGQSDEVPKSEEARPAHALPNGIKELPNGIWVLSEDTHISKWVEQEGRLDHDQNSLPDILKHIREGDTVIDAGAFIGDHTIAYLNAVGEEGKVYAFEPNHIAMKCLMHNIAFSDEHKFWAYERALGDKAGVLPLSGNNNNSGGCYIGDHMKIGDVEVVTLDSFNLAPNFIKWDIEGCEFKALKGAEQTILKHNPIMVIEMNTEALARQGDKVEDIVDFLVTRGYRMEILQSNCTKSSPMYDLIAFPVFMRNEPTELSHGGKRDNPLSSERKAEPGLEVGIRGGENNLTNFPVPVPAAPPDAMNQISGEALEEGIQGCKAAKAESAANSSGGETPFKRRRRRRKQRVLTEEHKAKLRINMAKAVAARKSKRESIQNNV